MTGTLERENSISGGKSLVLRKQHPGPFRPWRKRAAQLGGGCGWRTAIAPAKFCLWYVVPSWLWEPPGYLHSSLFLSILFQVTLLETALQSRPNLSLPLVRCGWACTQAMSTAAIVAAEASSGLRLRLMLRQDLPRSRLGFLGLGACGLIVKHGMTLRNWASFFVVFQAWSLMILQVLGDMLNIYYAYIQVDVAPRLFFPEGRALKEHFSSMDSFQLREAGGTRIPQRAPIYGRAVVTRTVTKAQSLRSALAWAALGCKHPVLSTSCEESQQGAWSEFRRF
uniref:Uncharacterized protein n=1 Tax=Pan troglodytes TaxID=9598 RepID=A0A2I3SI71_PANTR